jgi:hypothetical protein
MISTLKAEFKKVNVEILMRKSLHRKSSKKKLSINKVLCFENAMGVDAGFIGLSCLGIGILVFFSIHRLYNVRQERPMFIVSLKF